MNRYIDAEWLLGVAELSNGVVDIDDIYNAPTIDAVRVVRCNDCRWSEPNEFGDLDCRYHIPIFRVNADGYCSYGKSKENE